MKFVSFGFGMGLLPCMPGTFGTLLGAMFYFFLRQFSLLTYSIVVYALFVFGIVVCDVTNRHLKSLDHPRVVWDEMVGFLFVMVSVPKIWYYVAVGFVLFRTFDIWKPWPIEWIEKNIKGGMGVMVDDTIAALYAWSTLMAIINFKHLFTNFF
nr:phosphatidylglycerophosphatase A [Coxiella endosymbiont of Amblyomma sculptum]